jgi:hypothetical protein
MSPDGRRWRWRRWWWRWYQGGSGRCGGNAGDAGCWGGAGCWGALGVNINRFKSTYIDLSRVKSGTLRAKKRGRRLRRDALARTGVGSVAGRGLPACAPMRARLCLVSRLGSPRYEGRVAGVCNVAQAAKPALFATPAGGVPDAGKMPALRPEHAWNRGGTRPVHGRDAHATWSAVVTRAGRPRYAGCPWAAKPPDRRSAGILPASRSAGVPPA